MGYPRGSRTACTAFALSTNSALLQLAVRRAGDKDGSTWASWPWAEVDDAGLESGQGDELSMFKDLFKTETGGGSAEPRWGASTAGLTPAAHDLPPAGATEVVTCILPVVAATPGCAFGLAVNAEGGEHVGKTEAGVKVEDDLLSKPTDDLVAALTGGRASGDVTAGVPDAASPQGGDLGEQVESALGKVLNTLLTSAVWAC